MTYMLLKPGSEAKEHYLIMAIEFDKYIHFGIFGLLSFLFLLSFPKIKFWVFIQIILSYAFLSEILQDTMGLGRSLEGMDVVADMIGSLSAFLVFSLLPKNWKK